MSGKDISQSYVITVCLWGHRRSTE